MLHSNAYVDEDLVAYIYLLAHLESRASSQIPADYVRLDQNIHYEPVVIDPQVRRLRLKLTAAVQMKPLPPSENHTMNRYKTSVIKHICKLAGLNPATALENAAVAQKEDEDHFPERYMRLRDLVPGFINTPDLLACHDDDFGLEHSDIWSYERLWKTSLARSLHSAQGIYHPSKWNFIHVVFGRPHLVLSRVGEGYRCLGGIVIADKASSDSYVIEPLDSWFRSRFTAIES